jgi:hypothetical protein
VDAAVELLEGHRRGPLFSETQMLAKEVVEAVRSAPEAPPRGCGPAAGAALAAAVLHDAAAAAQRLNVVYGGVADGAGGRAWLAALPPSATGALREILDRVFVCQVSVLATTYDILEAVPPPSASGGRGFVGSKALSRRGAEGGTPVVAAAEAAAAALAALANLQFCALQLRAHGELVSRLSAGAAAAPAAALPPLLAALPSYSTFAAAYGSGAGHGGGFSMAPVAAARLAFLLPLAASNVPHVADPSEAACVVLPYVYLLLKGAPESVAQAAHSTWASLLAGLCAEEDEQQHGGDGGGGKGRSQLSRRDGGTALAVSMVPYYLERTVQEPCGVTDVEMLEWGLRQVQVQAVCRTCCACLTYTAGW